jgi:hypothetical protein
VYKRDRDRKIFTVKFFIANIKLKIEQFSRTMKTATLLAFLLLGLACTYGKSLKSLVFHAMNRDIVLVFSRLSRRITFCCTRSSHNLWKLLNQNNSCPANCKKTSLYTI